MLVLNDNVTYKKLICDCFKVVLSLVLVILAILFLGRLSIFFIVITSTIFFAICLQLYVHYGIGITIPSEIDWIDFGPCKAVFGRNVPDDHHYNWYNICRDKAIKIIYDNNINVEKIPYQRVRNKDLIALAAEAQKRYDESVIKEQKY